MSTVNSSDAAMIFTGITYIFKNICGKVLLLVQQLFSLINVVLCRSGKSANVNFLSGFVNQTMVKITINVREICVGISVRIVMF